MAVHAEGAGVPVTGRRRPDRDAGGVAGLDPDGGGGLVDVAHQGAEARGASRSRDRSTGPTGPHQSYRSEPGQSGYVNRRRECDHEHDVRRSQGKSRPRADNSEWMDHAVRVGLVSYGVVHLLMAWLALRLAFGDGGGSASSQGALQQLAAERPRAGSRCTSWRSASWPSSCGRASRRSGATATRTAASGPSSGSSPAARWCSTPASRSAPARSRRALGERQGGTDGMTAS